MKVIREDKQDTALISKNGRCNYCNGRGYLGTPKYGYNCLICNGTGANRAKKDK